MSTRTISTTLFTKLASSNTVQTASGVSKMLSTKSRRYNTTSGSLAERISSKPQHEKKGTLSNRIMQILSKNKNGVTFNKIITDISRNRPVVYDNFNYTVKRSLAQLINWKMVNVSTSKDSMMFSMRKNSK